jgi:hypothetical protein
MDKDQKIRRELTETKKKLRDFGRRDFSLRVHRSGCVEPKNRSLEGGN